MQELLLVQLHFQGIYCNWQVSSMGRAPERVGNQPNLHFQGALSGMGAI